MNPRQRELFRNALLVAISDFPASYPPSVHLLKQEVTRHGFVGIEEAEITTELVYLADKGLVVEDKKLVSPENKNFRLTAEGRDYLAEKGLA